MTGLPISQRILSPVSLPEASVGAASVQNPSRAREVQEGQGARSRSSGEFAGLCLSVVDTADNGGRGREKKTQTTPRVQG